MTGLCCQSIRRTNYGFSRNPVAHSSDCKLEGKKRIHVQRQAPVVEAELGHQACFTEHLYSRCPVCGPSNVHENGSICRFGRPVPILRHKHSSVASIRCLAKRGPTIGSLVGEIRQADLAPNVQGDNVQQVYTAPCPMPSISSTISGTRRRREGRYSSARAHA